jgi:peroxiredoxin
MKKIIVILLGLICLPAASAFALKLNDSAPAFSLGDSAGKDFYLSDVVGATKKENGQGIVLSFFASCCAEKYGVRFLPTTFFIGADGTVKDVIYGEIKDEKELMDSVQKLLKK